MNGKTCARKGVRRVIAGAAALAACVIASVVAAQISANHGLRWAVVSGGGGLRMSNNHELRDALGQSIAGLALSANNRIESGFVAGLAAEGGGGMEFHSADQDQNSRISLSELLRAIQFYNSGGLHCAIPSDSTEDGYMAGPNPAQQACAPHASDYNPQNWIISLSELLRLVQFYNSDGYYACPLSGAEDGFCAGTASR